MRVLLIIAFLIWSNVGLCQISGKVVSIADGDTFTLLTPDKKQMKIRLHGIDCPEKKQAFGEVARQFTANQVFGKQVWVDERDTDRYGRTIAIVYTPDSFILNELLLERGLAWHYYRYDKSTQWAKLQKAAAAARVGLWRDHNPIPPWEFRKTRRK